MWISTGALARGGSGDEDAVATVEYRTIAQGGSPFPVVLLAVVRGDYATPALESVKDAFGSLTFVDVAAARQLVAAASPPLASACAVVLLAGGRTYVWASGSARLHRQRGGAVSELGPGEHDLLHGDVVAAVTAPLDVTVPWLTAVDVAGGAGRAQLGVATFRNDGLDDALSRALAKHAAHRGPLAVALALVGYSAGA